jgi:SAM-dependent methyltransferase
MHMTTESAAAAANSADSWDRIWSNPEEPEWRARVLEAVYDRIVELAPRGCKVVDVGGGVGTLAFRLADERDCQASVADISEEAIRQVRERNKREERDGDAEVGWAVYDANTRCMSGYHSRLMHGFSYHLIVSTECYEHLDERGRRHLLEAGSAVYDRPGLIVSIPNNRLGPDEEPQHTIKRTAKEFLDELRAVYGADCRVEVMGGFLLGVCGKIAHKEFTLSVTMPVRDEERDIEQTLASFRGVADQMVIGVDYRSKDRTREIAAQYADEVFEIEDPRGPPDDLSPKVHFAHCRNRCLDKCTSDWIFMSEGHEWLRSGADELLHLDALNPAVRVAFVKRTGVRQQWGFPWLHRNDPKIRYERGTHNVLIFPPKYYAIHMPGVSTRHKRHEDNAASRLSQRKLQNRLTLTDDWVKNGNDNSLMYLGAEWAPYDESRAVERLREFLAVNRSNGPQRYHARLQCARLLARAEKYDDARLVLLGAEADDWSRVDHWFYLGDLASLGGEHEKALQWYLYASTRLGNPPFAAWWIDLSIYGYLTAQRLVETYATLGQLDAALGWAERTLELMEEDDDGFPDEAFVEARQNIVRIQEALNSHDNAAT